MKKTRQSNVTNTRDPLLEPFYIVEDEFSFSLRMDVLREGGKPYTKNLGYYVSMAHALKGYLKHGMLQFETSNSLDEYFDRLEIIQNNLEKFMEKYNNKNR
jgi:hypothetical protein